MALEDDIEEYDFPLLRLGMQLVVDGTEPEIIDNIFAARIISENGKGKKFLEQMLIVTGVEGIQAGDNPRILMEKLFAFFGSDADDLKNEYLVNVVAGREDEMLEEFQAADGVFSEQFDELQSLMQFDDRAIQKVLRELDLFDLSRIVAGADRQLRLKITDNMSRRAAVALAESSTYGGAVLDSIQKAVAKLFELVEKLQELGEIVAPSE